MTGNVTSDFPTLFRTISVSLGFDPTVLFLAGFGLFAFSLSILKAPKSAYPIAFLMYSFFGSTFGLVPAWVEIVGFIFVGIYSMGQVAKLFGGDLPSESSSPKPWLRSITEPEPEIEIEKTENCKNCGGPNVDRVTCQYCGLVLE